MAKLSRIAPEVPVDDLRESLDYYEHKLGFQVVMQMPAGGDAIVERDDVAMHIFTHQLDDLLSELRQRGAHLAQPITRRPWGNRDFRVNDRSGNEIKFTEPLPDDA